MGSYIKNLEDLPCWCGNHSYHVLIRPPRQNFEILRCSQCGLARTFPLPDFSKERYADYKIDVYLKNKKLFLSFMKKILKEVLMFKTKGHLLEIGSGVGYFLELAKNQGFEIQGLELSKKAVQETNKNLGKGVAKNYLLKEAGFSFEYFDIIVMNHVLEHILDLKNLLDEISRILKKDGILVIGSPNFGGFFAKIKGRKWSGLRPNEHIWQFEPSTIIKILEFENFQVIRSKKKAAHNIRSVFTFSKKFSLKILLSNALNWFLGTVGFGDNMFIIAKKIQ